MAETEQRQVVPVDATDVGQIELRRTGLWGSEEVGDRKVEASSECDQFCLLYTSDAADE